MDFFGGAGGWVPILLFLLTPLVLTLFVLGPFFGGTEKVKTFLANPQEVSISLTLDLPASKRTGRAEKLAGAK